jgi:hypothetical protein
MAKKAAVANIKDTHSDKHRATWKSILTRMRIELK